ncbi:ribose 5-phosphate isomerase B [Humitalea rosea]|uniref:Ribose 5-phosphate isomerase B n=1 Tax=Humitalea rosea TaxID=990373 RepID=A0A2W7IP64_9PROT|nr:ribose 5-phosphate isomerase B [Humitalea rosea]PZW49032.1 ribose 5-phosphate isomerase B [Humitalea rosea]
MVAHSPPSLSLAIGADHAGVAVKAALIEALTAAGHRVTDCGTDGPASVDYPDFAQAVAGQVTSGQVSLGVLVCGTGIGMCIAANRLPGIRAAVLHSTTEARLTRAHNDANMACFGARTTGIEIILDSLHAFLATPYEGGRHDRRLRKLSAADAALTPSEAAP